MTEHSGWEVFVQKQESTGKSWPSVGDNSWPGWKQGCGQAATTEQAPCPPSPVAPLAWWEGGSL